MSDGEKLVAGAKAPNFEILNQDGKSVSLADYKGQKVIIYFYPAASTPGCTKEACDFCRVFHKVIDIIGHGQLGPGKLRQQVFREVQFNHCGRRALGARSRNG